MTGRAAWQRRAFLFVAIFGGACSLALPTALLGAWLGARHALDDIQVTPALVASLVVGAPVTEELLFRAGLRTPVYTLFFGPPLVLVAVAFLNGIAALWTAAAAVGVVAAILDLAVERRHQRQAGARHRLGRDFVSRYPLVFWAWTAAFAIGHVVNLTFDSPALAATGPSLVLPQLAAGAILGYARLTIGLGSAMALHAALNGVVVAALAGLT